MQYDEYRQFLQQRELLNDGNGGNNIGANQIGGANEVKQAAKDRRLLATTPAVKQARNERRANNRRLATHKVKEAAKDTRFMATTTAL